MERNALCGQAAHFVYNSGNTYSNHRALKGYVLTTVDTNF